MYVTLHGTAYTMALNGKCFLFLFVSVILRETFANKILTTSDTRTYIWLHFTAYCTHTHIYVNFLIRRTTSRWHGFDYSKF